MYEDIIDLPHHVSEQHPRMSMMDRVAQLSPFTALRATMRVWSARSDNPAMRTAPEKHQ